MWFKRHQSSVIKRAKRIDGQSSFRFSPASKCWCRSPVHKWCSLLLLSIAISVWATSQSNEISSSEIPLVMHFHRYAVGFACAANFALAVGSSLCLGIFTEIFMDSFAINNAEVSLIMSLLVSLLFGMSPMVLPVIKKFGCRRMLMLSGLLVSGCYITASFLTDFSAFLLIIGVLLGVVSSVIYTCSILVVPQIFVDQKSRQVAFSLTNVGTGAGGLLFPLIYETLLHNYSWRQTMFITGAIMLNLVPLAMLFPEHLCDYQDKEANVDGDLLEKRQQKRSMWRSATFLLLHPCFFVVQGVTSTFYTFLFPLLHEHGVSSQMAALVLMIVQGISIPGRITPALTRDLIKVHTFHQFCVFATVFAVSIFIICVFGGARFVAVVGAVFVGYSMGSMFSIFPIAMSDLYHDSQLHFALSVTSFSFGLGGFLTPIGIDFLVDRTGTYIIPLAGISSVSILITMFLLVYRIFRQPCVMQVDARLSKVDSE